jgi:hypothetical protein
VSAIEFDKLYSDRKPPKRAGRPSMKVKGDEFRRVKSPSHEYMIDVYRQGICTHHIWKARDGRWFEIPAGSEGEKREVKAPPAWVLK